MIGPTKVVIDCQDLHAQARWWAGVLDWQLVYEADDQAAIAPKHEQDRPLSAEEWPTVGPALVFVPVPEGKTMKNRLHLDRGRASMLPSRAQL